MSVTKKQIITDGKQGGIMLDEHYASVIIERYINFKGSDADVYLIDGDEKIPYSEVI